MPDPTLADMGPNGCLQAMVRMQSAWYRVTVEPPDLLLTLVGNCGGEGMLWGCSCMLLDVAAAVTMLATQSN
jgi:hypothetical protein